MNTKNLMHSSFTPLVYNLSRSTPLDFWENKSLKSELPSDGTNKIKNLVLYRRSSYLYFLTLPPTQHLIPYNSTPAQTNQIICVRFPCPAVSVNRQKSINQQLPCVPDTGSKVRKKDVFMASSLKFTLYQNSQKWQITFNS